MMAWKRDESALAPMELQEFVETTILQVMHAVKGAQQKWAEEMDGGGVINPSWGEADLPNRVQSISFDVAVTAGSKTEGGAGGSVKVWGAVEALGRGSRSIESSTVSRVSFSVPVLLAPVTIKADADSS